MRLLGGAAPMLALALSTAWLGWSSIPSPLGTPASLSTQSQSFGHTQKGEESAQKPLSFGDDVLPILSDKCFKCHGPDISSRMADLRLDTPEGAYASRGGRWPIVPGKPQDSLLVKKINDPDDPMPPAFSGKSLTKEEKATLTRWIAEGGKYGKLWSFESLPPSIPVPTEQSRWIRNDIDRFVLAEMTAQKLRPSAPASRERWLRRATLDLTGLPPTEEEIAAFKHDGDEAKVVDRLLASQHFGEKMAVDWLDAARYSDSYGYQSDLLMPTWPYRDWVIRAINQNMPYDQFVTDQIAGDLLPHATRDQVLATAFNRLHRQSNEGGSIALEFKTEYAVDRVSTYGTSMLGLTVGCARCHDHKFDPISQKEFYQLFGYFNSIDEYGLLLSTEIVPTPSLLLPTLAQSIQLKDLHAKSDAVEASLKEVERQTQPRYEQWLKTKPAHLEIPGLAASLSLDTVSGDKLTNDMPGKIEAAKIGDPKLVPGHRGQALLFDGDDGLVVRGLKAKERFQPFTWSFWVNDPRQAGPIILLHRTGGTDVGFCGFDLLLEDGYLTARVMRHWPGNAVAVKTKTRIAKNDWQHVGWTWDGSGSAAGLKLYVNGQPAATEVLADKLWKNIDAYGDLGPSGGEWSFAQRFRDAGFKGGKLDDVSYADRELSPLEMAQLFDGKSLDSASDSPALREYYDAAIDPECAAACLKVQQAQEALMKAEEPVQEISVMQEAKPEIPAYLLARGNYDSPRTAATLVHRDVPKSLPPLRAKGANDRLALAQWTVRKDNPLTARVEVNRIWQMLFGVGLVATSENFGVQGSRPTERPLLDYLARRLMDSGWNVKALVREIALSATYAQDSVRTSKLLDSENHYLARGPSRRLSAEEIRDTALAAAGLLDKRIGGPPVNPYQPAGLWQENNTMSPAFVQSKGADLYRRSIYSTWKRTTPVPSMMMFDATSREACTMRRPATNTPLQALVLLNDVQFVEAARVLAELVLQRPGSDMDRIRAAFVRLSGREPDNRESQILMDTLRDQRGQFSGDTVSAKKLIAMGDSKAPTNLNVSELAAMTVVVQTILNSDAVIWER